HTGHALARVLHGAPERKVVGGASGPIAPAAEQNGRGPRSRRKGTGTIPAPGVARFAAATGANGGRLKAGLRQPANRSIVVRGAAQHNLQGIDVEIPRHSLSVFCGPSGSGKSSLAMDTLYAEGQRRYVESLSAYARQFLGQMPKPRVEHISGLSPAIAIEQKSVGNTPRSTVGTVTEIYDYLRILFARLGKGHCSA